tara:strand:- start:541 stop:795 length:255 start_codon:yes stop_codon:yes gene_type:complete
MDIEHKVNEQLKDLSENVKDLSENVKDISDRLSKLEIKESNKMDRAKVWSLAAAHVAGATNCQDCSTAINWADKILAKYDERFT